MAKLKIAKELFDILHPIGSVYLSSKATNPATLFGYGTWVQVIGKYILTYDYNGSDAGRVSSGSSSGATLAWSGTSGSWSGTSGSHTLTINEIPSHAHEITAMIGSTQWASGYVWARAGDASTGNEKSSWAGKTTNTGNGGGHTHSIPSHTHSIPSHSHEIPWVAFYCWYRTA